MKSATWQLQEAKNRFSELVERARTEGEQTITKHGRPVAVLVSVERLQRLRGKRSLLRHLRSCPSPGLADLIGPRSKETVRTIDLA